MAGLVGLDGVVEVGLGWWFRWERLAVGALVGWFRRFRSLVVSSSVRDPRCWFLVCWCCFGCVGSACPACVALCCSALPCVRFVCSGRDELIVLSNPRGEIVSYYLMGTLPVPTATRHRARLDHVLVLSACCSVAHALPAPPPPVWV